MIINDFLKTSGDEIQETVNLLTKKGRCVDRPHALLKKLYKAFSDSTKGGKHIRGTLVRIGFLLMDNTESTGILPIAAAYEILHTSLLIHDDIIDNSGMRRGEKSLWHKVGQHQALCLGDLGFFVCYKTISESSFPPGIKTQATSLLSEIVMQTIAGEMLDIALSEKDVFKKEKDVLLIHSLKTARYTISGPLMLGALLGGADGKVMQQIKQFGEHLGIAFQIQDDILGIFGNEKELGKSVISDIKENKNTLLITYALRHAHPAQKKFLKEVYGKENLTVNEWTEIKNIFEETGSLAYSQKKAKDYTEKAKKLIPEITSDFKMLSMLSELADVIVERKK